MTTQLAKYEAACKALAEARSVNEVMQIKDAAEAYRAAARIAKNKEMEADAIEIRFRAERRLGELMEAQKATVGLNTGTAGKGRPSKKGGVKATPPKDDRPTLKEAGIDKELAKRARVAAEIKAPDFETRIGRLHNRAKVGDGRLTVSIANLSTEPRRRMRVVGQPKERMSLAEATTKLKITAGKVDLVIDQLLRLKPERESPNVVETIILLGFMQGRLIEWYSEFDPSVVERLSNTDSAAEGRRKPTKAKGRAITESTGLEASS